MVGVLRSPFVLADTPAGTRMVFELASGTVDGERLRGRLVGRSGADWMVVGPDGTGSLDVRLLVETHDGALVLVHYTGRVDTTVPGAPIYATPRFTAHERYRWLNRVQAVAKGTLDGSTLTYELHQPSLTTPPGVQGATDHRPGPGRRTPPGPPTTTVVVGCCQGGIPDATCGPVPKPGDRPAAGPGQRGVGLRQETHRSA